MRASQAATEPRSRRRRWLILCVAASLVAASVLATLYLVKWGPLRAIERQARAAVAARRFDEARRLLDQWTALRPSGAEPYYLRACVEVAADRPQPAQAALESALARGYDRRPCELLFAVLLARGGKYEQAEPLLRQAFEQTSRPAPEVDEALARIYLGTFRLDRAAEVIDRWVKDAPADARPYLWRNQVDQWNDAGSAVLIQNYRMALQRDPNSLEARLGLADTLRAARRMDEAQAEYAACLARNPKSIEARVGAGQVALEQGDVAAAARSFEQVLALDPNQTTARLELALIDLRQGRSARARDRLEALVSLDPYDPAVRYNFARALKLCGDERRAREQSAESDRLREDQQKMGEIRQALLRRPHDAETCYAAAKWMLDHGHQEEGLRWAQLLLRDHPGHQRTCELLAVFYQKAGNFGLANYYRQVSAGAP